MKRIALFAAVITLAACSAKEAPPVADSAVAAVPAMAAPASAADSMKKDSTAVAAPAADSTKH